MEKVRFLWKLSTWPKVRTTGECLAMTTFFVDPENPDILKNFICFNVPLLYIGCLL